jgi:hypothetical protein
MTTKRNTRRSTGAGTDFWNAFEGMNPVENGADYSSLDTIIERHVKPPDAIRHLIAMTDFKNDRVRAAVMALVEEGIEQLTEEDRELWDDPESYFPPSRMPYPMREAWEYCLGQISVGGRGRNDLIDAITGVRSLGMANNFSQRGLEFRT